MGSSKSIGSRPQRTFVLNKKNRYLIYSTRRVSGITFIRVANIQQIGKPNNLKVCESNKTKRFQTGYQQSSNVTYP
jgi:hypothetical protein